MFLSTLIIYSMFLRFSLGKRNITCKYWIRYFSLEIATLITPRWSIFSDALGLIRVRMYTMYSLEPFEWWCFFCRRVYKVQMEHFLLNYFSFQQFVKKWVPARVEIFSLTDLVYCQILKFKMYRLKMFKCIWMHK